MPSSFPLLHALGLLLILAIGLHLGIKLGRAVLRHRVARTRKTGRRGEARALELLEVGGWKVLDREVTATGRMTVDGVEHEFLVRADALVKRGRRTCIAELKGGAEVSRITHRDTRRQLLEYARVFDVDGILLVDAKRRRIHEIRFS